MYRDSSNKSDDSSSGKHYLESIKWVEQKPKRRWPRNFLIGLLGGVGLVGLLISFDMGRQFVREKRLEELFNPFVEKEIVLEVKGGDKIPLIFNKSMHGYDYIINHFMRNAVGNEYKNMKIDFSSCRKILFIKAKEGNAYKKKPDFDERGRVYAPGTLSFIAWDFSAFRRDLSLVIYTYRFILFLDSVNADSFKLGYPPIAGYGGCNYNGSTNGKEAKTFLSGIKDGDMISLKIRKKKLKCHICPLLFSIILKR